jgi:hypothetical protein
MDGLSSISQIPPTLHQIQYGGLLFLANVTKIYSSNREIGTAPAENYSLAFPDILETVL